MEITRRGWEAHIGQKIVSSSWTSLPKRFPGFVRSIVCTPAARAPGGQGCRIESGHPIRRVILR
jgi:hypothetical protein